MTTSSKALDFSGTTTITDEGIRNHFKKDLEPWQPIAELVWNGFDAGAKSVRIITRESELGGTESVTVVDDGEGIDFTQPLNNFRRFNDSLKKKSHSTHGSKGRGRLAFHKVCANATWHTKYHGRNAIIGIQSSSLSNILGREIADSEQNALLVNQSHGTCVELTNFIKNLPQHDELLVQLQLEHGWHLAFNPEKSLTLNATAITPPPHTLTKHTIKVDDEEFSIELIQWSQKLNSEKSYTYLRGSDGVPLHHMPSSLNHKPGYYTSLLVSSPWLDVLSESDTQLRSSFEELSSSKVWKDFSKKLSIFTQTHYQEFLARLADEQIEGYIEEGDFPDYKGIDPAYSSWRLSNTKKIVKGIILADPKLFKNSSKKQRKIIIRLLDKISVSSENSSLLEILESVLELDATAMDNFANQIKRTKLQNIIQTIETLQKREHAIARIAEIMRSHYKETLETPDLQGVIESNTWLFGNQYESIGAEEDTFTKIAENLRSSIKEIDYIEEEDIDEGASIEGANRQVDLFLVRRQKQYDSNNQPYFRCVIIEIKRPSVALNKKHLRQIDDYAAILARHPEFNGIRTKYEIILVGRKISDSDFDIQDRLNSLLEKNDPGLIGSGTLANPIKKYVKTWKTITEEFEISHDFMLSTLKTQRDRLEIESTKEGLLESLHQKTA
ncbi:MULTISPECIES: ATP-binding protein [Pseudomonas]|uniref:ATP-binding protein n=1 Tax=Pseudomonas TaxID=286 RepID=UPI000876FBE0|nr:MULTISPECIES: ATP-binding protein [Pseudomonas]ROL86514.1 hypothetical protein BK639_28335 [Pseudomonas protegens]ROL95149.1 hypothetical protein BK640_29105 [Pseudomonas protegens]ROL97862.1 hypothetical protein BK641_27000 [Pseudomonas protegens]ROM07649.1 hypothetical protein BK642_13900 [Pseudomonas protegens]SCZ74158.1 Histidine kinase-, DNA gyrase B-, and HSP90-like ATPase [Pseudomonas sp. NFPP17]